MQAANANVAATAPTGDVVGQARDSAGSQEELPSLISVEVVGYGGGDDDRQSRKEDDDRKDPAVMGVALPGLR